jgi:hypothetical protein
MNLWKMITLDRLEEIWMFGYKFSIGYDSEFYSFGFKAENEKFQDIGDVTFAVGLESVFSSNRASAVLICNDRCIAIVKSDDGYRMFDPHPNSKFAFPSHHGTAVVVTASSIDTIEAVCVRAFNLTGTDLKKQQFQIYRVEVSKEQEIKRKFLDFFSFPSKK